MLSVKTEFSATSGIRLIVQDIDPSYTLGDIEAKLRQIRTALSREGVIDRNRQLASPTAIDIKNRLLSVLDAQKDDLPRYDAICIIRGGGSVADLYWLNDLDLAMAVCNCPFPILTGIGHERDNTILDEIANRRFDTPSKVIGHIRDVICGNAYTATAHYQQIMLSA